MSWASVANPSKAKGTAFESACVSYWRANGFPDCSRLPLAGAKDIGDIRGLWPLLTVECKAYKDVVAGARLGVKQAAREAKSAGTPFFAAVVKQPRASVELGHVVMTLANFTALLRHIREISA